MTSLLLGAGNSRHKKVALTSAPDWNGELTTLDMNPYCGATVVWDIERRPLPFVGEQFDELAAYDVLEHIGKLGDWRGWFDEMSEYHRILKPGGLFGILVPIGDDALADPGHTRFFGPNHFAMLNQDFYRTELEAERAVTDYRWYWRKNFEILMMQNIGSHHLAVMLRKA